MPSDTRYRKVAEQLEELIRSGRYAPGDQLPNQEQLAASFGVSVTTVRSALELVRARGYVDTVRSRGSFVRRRDVDRRRYSPDFPRGGPVNDAHGDPLDMAYMDVLSVERIAASGEVAEWLEIDQGDEVVVRRRVWIRHGKPVMGWDTYIPRALVMGTVLEGPAGTEGMKQGTYVALEQLGYARPWKAGERLQAREATDAERLLLNLGEGAWVIETHRTTRLASDGRVIEGLHVFGGAFNTVFTFEELDIPADADIT